MSSLPAAQGISTRPGAFLVVGDLNVDLVLRLPRIPGPDEEVEATELEMTPGGTAGNVAVGMARLGLPVAVMSCVGDDAFGQDLLTHLQGEGIQTQWCAHDSLPTGLCFAAVQPDGDRRLMTHRGANRGLQVTHLVPEAFQWSEGVHLTGVDEAIARRVCELAAQERVPLSFDPGNMMCSSAPDAVLETGARSWLTFISLTEARLLLSEDDVDAVARTLHVRGWHDAVLKMGAKGSLLLRRGRVAYHVRAFHVPAVDTTGAGDAYEAGFLWAYARGNTLVDCMRYGSAVAALAIGARGGQAGLPTPSQVQGFLERSQERAGRRSHR